MRSSNPVPSSSAAATHTHANGEVHAGASHVGPSASDEEDDQEEETEEELVTRCGELMTKSDIVLFMKGDRNTPRCGFSQKIVGILEGQGVEYTTFDILSDDSVRQSESPAPP